MSYDWTSARTALGLADRREQTELFERVLADPANLIGVEGPTGIGKSALVAPIVGSGERVVYSARSKAQQHQMAVFADEKLLPGKLLSTWALLFGRNEYVCLRRAQEAGYRLGTTLRGDGSRRHYPDVDELDWGSVNSDGDQGCSAKRCGPDDARNVAVARAREADLVITNHNVLMLSSQIPAHVSPLGETFDRTLIVDEAHDLPGVISDTLGCSVSPARLTKAAGLFRRSTGRVSAIERAAPIWRELLQSYRDTPEAVWHHQETALALGRAVHVEASKMDDGDRGPLDRLALDLALLGDPDDEIAYSMSVEAPFSANPKAVAKALITSQPAKELFGQYEQTFVMSATLTGLPASQLGLDTLHVGDSPFDLVDRRLGYVTSKVSKAGDDWEVEELGRLIESVGGRGALVLATSYSQKERAGDELEALGYRVGLQGKGSSGVGELVEQFKAGRLDVLVGTDSLMTGIDIPGDALRLVVLLKWPTPAFKRPFEAAMALRLRARGLNEWSYYFDPVAEVKARQSVGRLIRTTADYGVVACLDPRQRNKMRFRRLVAPSTYTSELADVSSFVGGFE